MSVKILFIAVAVIAMISLAESTPAGSSNCPGVCPSVFQPVCGKMGSRFKTFSNSCLLNAENKCRGGRWSLVSNGQCSKKG